MLTYHDAKRLLERHGQPQVLRFWDQLDDGGRHALLAQIDALDFAGIELMRDRLAARHAVHDPAPFEPAPVMDLSAAERASAREAGERLLRSGKVAVLLVAGGQGTRLGFAGPKGAFPIGPVSGASLFAIHAGKVAALERRFRTRIPFYMMTSEANDADTRRFFEQNAWCGLSKERVLFFVQGMWPALTDAGKIMLDRHDHIFMSPDGHGGVLRALRERGMLADMKARGVEVVFFFQVDNPLVDIADPVFIGLHAARRADMSIKVCAKRDPDEGLGVVVTRGGRDAIVEYTELTVEQKCAVLPDGELKYKFGSVAIHVFSREFLEKEADAGLPLHVAHKKVPFCDDSGTIVMPSAPNAYKFEKFIFDALPHAARSVNLVFDRAEEFSPVKNASGNDSPMTAQRDMMRKFKRWFDACGVSCPVDGEGNPAFRIEISPLYAMGPAELGEKLPPHFAIEGDTLLA